MKRLPIRFEPLRALRAAQALAKNPEDLPQVFTIIESLSFDSLSRVTERLLAEPASRRMVESRPDLVERLADRAALARLPAGSLGRAYLDFVEREQISAEGIRAAALVGAEATESVPEPYAWVHGRMRDTHDLWHVVTGFSGDVAGETALLGFTFAQMFNPSVVLIIAVGLWKTAKFPGVRSLVLDAYRRGRRAAWLPAVEWEKELARPLAAVRADLNLEATPPYQEIRPAEVRQAA